MQLLDGVLVDVLRFAARSMNVGMRVLVRMGVFVGVRMHRSVGMPVLVRVDVRMDMRVGVSVFDLGRHGVLLFNGQAKQFGRLGSDK